MEETLMLTEEWDKVFPQSSKVNHRKVTFHNRYGITLAADLYKPKGTDGRLAAIAVAAALCAAVYGVLWAAGVPVSEEMVMALFCASPLLALAWGAAMYRAACGIFAKTEC